MFVIMGHKGSKLTQEEMRELLKCTYCKFMILLITLLLVSETVFELDLIWCICLLQR